MDSLQKICSSAVADFGDTIRSGILTIKCDGMKGNIELAANNIMSNILEHMFQDAKLRAEGTAEEYELILSRVKTKPTTEIELVKLEQFIEASQETMKDLAGQVASLFKWCDLISK